MRGIRARMPRGRRPIAMSRPRMTKLVHTLRRMMTSTLASMCASSRSERCAAPRRAASSAALQATAAARPCGVNFRESSAMPPAFLAMLHARPLALSSSSPSPLGSSSRAKRRSQRRAPRPTSATFRRRSTSLLDDRQQHAPRTTNAHQIKHEPHEGQEHQHRTANQADFVPASPTDWIGQLAVEQHDGRWREQAREAPRSR